MITHLPNLLSDEAQVRMLNTIREIDRLAPFYTPKYGNRPMRLMQTNCGTYGWLAGPNRYEKINPHTGQLWPRMPKNFQSLAVKLAEKIGHQNFDPQCCLINLYSVNSVLPFHQDNDEHCNAPIISISLGSSCIFQVKEGNEILDYQLNSGDAIILSHEHRYAYHSAARIIPNTSKLLKDDKRINLTFRQVFPF